MKFDEKYEYAISNAGPAWPGMINKKICHIYDIYWYTV